LNEQVPAEVSSSLAHGLWPSPISPRSLAQGIRLSEVCWDTDGQTLVWLEGRSDRGVLVSARLDRPAPLDATSDLSVRAFVGYGGGDFTVGLGKAYFVSDGRIYSVPLSGGTPKALTPPFGQAASPALSPDGRWLIYVHSDESTDCIAIVDVDGRYWPQKLASGRDFYMQPRWHPNGDRIAWVAWDHPRMPWDGTDIWLAGLDFSGSLPRVSTENKIAGGHDVSVFQPEFSPDGGSIAYCSDESGFSQLYLHSLNSGSVARLTDDSFEYGRPAWVQGMRTYSFAGPSLIACVRRRDGFDSLQVVETSGRRIDLPAGFGRYSDIAHPVCSPDGTKVAAVVSTPDIPPRIVSFDLESRDERVWAHSISANVLPSQLARPEAIAWRSLEGEAYGLFYPPVRGRQQSPGLPPLVVIVHGGPTSQMGATYHAQSQFLTTRGYAVLEVNYRGSTGYGREYMLRLRGNWGIYDVEDSVAGATFLAEQGRVDPRRRVIMGGSAGGFTVLQTLVTHAGFFTAAVCMYGVSNQFTLATDTHKFEQHYLDSLLGPLPQAADVYRERSPIFHADKISDPIALFQGDIDRVVPRAQSDEIVASLRQRNIPHEYHVFEGEGHGWRKSSTIEAFYSALDRFLRQYVVFA
jgi:dipeptidyl aminopeptidase/acylaminoacyl peptidase